MFIKNLVLILFVFTLNYQIHASIGCMDRSFHMQLANDKKEYHFVRCDCPCENILSQRGKCSRCLHYGRPNRGEFNALQKFDIIYR